MTNSQTHNVLLHTKGEAALFHRLFRCTFLPLFPSNVRYTRHEHTKETQVALLYATVSLPTVPNQMKDIWSRTSFTCFHFTRSLSLGCLFFAVGQKFPGHLFTSHISHFVCGNWTLPSLTRPFIASLFTSLSLSLYVCLWFLSLIFLLRSVLLFTLMGGMQVQIAEWIGEASILSTQIPPSTWSSHILLLDVS